MVSPRIVAAGLAVRRAPFSTRLRVNLRAFVLAYLVSEPSSRAGLVPMVPTTVAAGPRPGGCRVGTAPSQLAAGWAGTPSTSHARIPGTSLPRRSVVAIRLWAAVRGRALPAARTRRIASWIMAVSTRMMNGKTSLATGTMAFPFFLGCADSFSAASPGPPLYRAPRNAAATLTADADAVADGLLPGWLPAPGDATRGATAPDVPGAVAEHGAAAPLWPSYSSAPCRLISASRRRPWGTNALLQPLASPVPSASSPAEPGVRLRRARARPALLGGVALLPLAAFDALLPWTPTVAFSPSLLRLWGWLASA